MNHHDDMASFGLMVRDRGHGKVMQHANFPTLRYRIHPQDAKDVVDGLKLIAETFFAAGAQRVLLPFVGPNRNEFDHADQLQRIDATKIKGTDIILSGFHPQGTAGIGRVVDGNLKVFGSERIYVCDASVLPDSPGVNPQVTIMAFAHRLAEHLQEL